MNAEIEIPIIDKEAGIAVEQSTDVLAHTFEEARHRTKQIGDELAIGLLNDNVLGADGSKSYFVKHYLDNDLPDNEELEISDNPDALSDIHNEIVGMIADNLSIRVRGYDAKQKQYLVAIKEGYIRRITSDGLRWSDLVSQYASEGNAPKGIATTAEFRGFNVSTTDGNLDISEFGGQKVSNIRPNIRVQRELTGQYIHWDTKAYGEAKVKGEPVEVERRIYLNPHTLDLVKTFSTIMATLEEHGLSAHGKMLDRSYELIQQMNSADAKLIRADSIVLGMSEADADIVLGIILDLYQTMPEVFSDRPIAKVPTRIAQGIAVGDEPTAKGESLTSHRAGILEEAKVAARVRLGLNSGDIIPENEEAAAILELRKIFAEIAEREGVDPNNMAFNLRAA